MKNSAFKKWFQTFVDEKGIDLEATFSFENENGFNLMPYGVVVEAIAATESPAQQKAIKATIVKIDFFNGDVYHYFRYLGRALANTGKAVS